MSFARRDESDASAWTAAGFLFAGKAYGVTDAALPQMANLTMEVCGHFPAASQNNGSSNYPIYISNYESGKEFAAYTQSTWTTLSFKPDPAGATSRPSMSQWDGKGFSCVLDTAAVTLHCVTNGVFDSSAKARSTQTAVNSSPWILANSGANADYLLGGDNYTRQAYGTYSAVRIYNRALTAEEVAANRTLDIIRFETGIPVTNAVVATSLAGAEGVEASGAYAVDGSHVFSAPGRVTVAGTEHFCTGHALEIWDSASSAWGAPTTSVATSRIVSEGEKVRITWLWSSAGAARSAATYGTGDYAAASNLVLHFDGIRNAGAGEGHDASATVWKDLTGNGNDGVCADPSVFSWVGGKGWSVSGDCKPVTVGTGIAKTLATTNFTMEIACTPAAANRRMCYFGQYNWNKGAVNVEHSTAGKLRLYRSANDNDASDWQSGVSVAAGDFTSLAFAVTPALSAIYKDGAPAASTSVAVLGNASPALGSVVGGELMAGSSRAGDAFDPTYKMAFNGTYSAFRLYDRALSDAEIAWNGKVDAVRFGGALTVTNVVVAGIFNDYSGAEPGEYEVIGTSYTFTAGTATDDGARHALAGYAIEEWDGSQWTGKRTFPGDSYTYAVGTSPAKVRLTWKWSSGTVLLFK